MNKYDLLAGAGKAHIQFPDEAFPTAKEKYTGVHDLPHARVLVLEQKGKIFTILNLEIVNVFPDTREKIVQALCEETEVNPRNIWYHNCHVLSTPHAWKVDLSDMRGPGPGSPGGPGGPSGNDRPKFTRSEQEQKSVELVSTAICDAVRAAAREAKAVLTPATIGSGYGYSTANANRNLEFQDGWWVSCNDEGCVEHAIPILRIDKENGDLLAVLFGFHAQPAVLDMLVLENGERLVSGDIAGYSTEFIEQEYPGSVAMYFTGAGGDGTPYFRGDYLLRGRGGRMITRNAGEKSYLLAEMLGERIGQQVLMATERIHTEQCQADVSIAEIKVTLPKRKREERRIERPNGPTRTFDFVEDGTIDMPLSAMRIGDMGFIGLIPEIDQQTAIDIREASPFATTMVSTFTNSGPTESGIGKYMGQKDCYDRVTFQAVNSMFAEGAAETTAKRAGELLMNVKEGTIDFSCKHDILIRNLDDTYQPMDEPFFEAEEIAPHTWKILSDGDYSYLIEGSKEAIVIDSGYGAGNIRAYCQSLVAVPVTSIINTHHHFDHTANNAYFEHVFMDGKAKEFATIPYPSFEGIYFPRNYDIIEVTDGFSIDLGDRILEIIQTPDHTQDGICILDIKEGILFTGDEFMNSKRLSGTVLHWKECLDKLMRHEDAIRMIYGGEGRMRDDIIQLQYEIVTKLLDGSLTAEADAGPGGPGGPGGGKPGFNPRNPETIDGHKVYYRKFPHPEDVQHAPKDPSIVTLKVEYKGYRFMFDADKMR